jgi:hypothetical protein
MANVFGVIAEILLIVLILWCINFISVLVHELGHALAYVLAVKDNNWSIEIGTGKKLIETSRFRIHIKVFSGYFTPKITEYSSNKNAIIMLLGGPIASLITTLKLFIILFSADVEAQSLISPSAASFMLYYALIYNAMLFIVSILPTEKSILKGYVSDGYKIRRILSE